MGLFGKKEEKKNVEQPVSRLDELKKQLEKKVKSLESKDGIRFDIKEDIGQKRSSQYLFQILDDEYIFMPIVKNAIYSRDEDVIQAAIDKPDIRLKKSECECTLLENDIKSENVVANRYTKDELPMEGEYEFSQFQIKINFKSDNSNFIAEISSMNDVAKNPDFFQSLGVKNYYNVIDIPEDNFPVTIQSGCGYLTEAQFLMMRNDGNLIFARKENGRRDDVCIASIPIDSIFYYKQEGSIRYEQEISGGGGGGVNYGAALVGGLLFGGAGAIVAGRHGTEAKEITTTHTEHDTRCVVLKFKKGNTIYNIQLDILAEQAFDWLMPEKEYSYVINKRRMMYESGIN